MKLMKTKAMEAIPSSPGFQVSKWKGGRFWALRDASGKLVCVCVYKKGAKEVKERLEGSQMAIHSMGTEVTANGLS